MNRCAQLSLALALAGSLAALAPAPAAAQALQRHFPQKALRGKVVFGVPPAISLNGVATHLSVGSRIHGIDNLLVLSGRLVGSTAIVDYTTDMDGAVFEVWILSPTEAAQPWPMTREQAAAWVFEPLSQTWTRP